MAHSLRQRAVAEFVGTALLLATVVGSGIMGDRLSSGNVAIALLANSLATGAALVALIATFASISGAHFNPVVTVCNAVNDNTANGRRSWRHVPLYIVAQVLGAFAGVFLAHVMFSEPAFTASTHARSGTNMFVSELIATFGLLTVIFGCSRADASSIPVPFAVGGYITAAYWFTSSTSFANPAVTIARSFTNTFAGIRPNDAPAFILAQCVGGALATVLFGWLHRSTTTTNR